MATTGSDAPPALGLRERKKQQTRETIAEVALDLFTRHGFHETTIRQVAEAANVAPRTVSLYFPAKEELVFAAYEEFFAALEARLTARRPGEHAADALGAFLREHAEDLATSHLDRARCVRELVEGEPGLRAFERGLQERAERVVAEAVAIDLGLPADALLPHMVGAATIAALDAMGRRAKEESGAHFVEDALADIDAAMAFVGAGVRALAGRTAGRPV